VPKPTLVGHLFDHLVGAQQNRQRDRETECLRGFRVDKEIEFIRFFEWKIARRSAPLIPKFAQECAANSCDLRNRSTTA